MSRQSSFCIIKIRWPGRLQTSHVLKTESTHLVLSGPIKSKQMNPKGTSKPPTGTSDDLPVFCKSSQKDQTCPIHHAKITHYINNYCLYGSSLLFLHPLCLVFSCFCTCSCSCTQCFMELRPCSFDLSVNTSRRVTIRTCRHPSIQGGGLDFS